MPANVASAPAAGLSHFVPRAHRTTLEERRLLEGLMDRVLAIHPAWPWPMIEEEARRQAEAIRAANRP